MSIKSIIADWKSKRAEARAKREFKLVGRITGTVRSSWFGGRMSPPVPAHAYLYQNGYGERKVEATDDILMEQPPVVYFLNGCSLAKVQQLAGPLLKDCPALHS
jgi:hypothetical protein